MFTQHKFAYVSDLQKLIKINPKWTGKVNYHLVRRRECHVVGRVGDDKPLGRRVLCDRHGGIPEPIQTYAKYSVCSEGECKQLPVGSVILLLMVERLLSSNNNCRLNFFFKFNIIMLF